MHLFRTPHVTTSTSSMSPQAPPVTTSIITVVNNTTRVDVWQHGVTTAGNAFIAADRINRKQLQEDLLVELNGAAMDGNSSLTLSQRVQHAFNIIYTANCDHVMNDSTCTLPDNKKVRLHSSAAQKFANSSKKNKEEYANFVASVKETCGAATRIVRSIMRKLVKSVLQSLTNNMNDDTNDGERSDGEDSPEGDGTNHHYNLPEENELNSKFHFYLGSKSRPMLQQLLHATSSQRTIKNIDSCCIDKLPTLEAEVCLFSCIY